MSIANRIKPNHLELLVKIAETQKLQLAAQAVSITQPAASRILAELEAQLGQPLFTRHPTGMEPTPAGEVLIKHGRVVLSELETIVTEIDRLGTGDLGHIRVGAVTGPTVGHLMPAVQAVLNTSPDLRISVDVAPSTVLFRGLEEGRYDFILGRKTPHSKTQDFRLHPGRIEIVSLMVHRSHPLAEKTDVEIAQLAHFPWIIQDEGNPIRDAIENVFHAHEIPVPSRILNSSSLLVALSQVSEGYAIAPQTEEVMRLLTSDKINADVTVLRTRTRIEVAPYFVIRNARRKLPRAAESLLNEVMSKL